MTERTHLLFVCSKNQWRSPTAEAIYRDDLRVSVRSRGTTRAAVRTIAVADFRWSDVVLVMEDKHRRRLLSTFPRETKYLPIYVLDISDDYQFMDETLQELIRAATEPILERLQSDDS